MFNFDNLRPEWVSSRSRDRMKAPPPVSAYASTGDVSSVGVMSRMGSMSEKIDQFLSVVQRCEDDLREEYEFRRRRMEEKKMLARAPWAGIRRSVSSISNYSGHNNNNNNKQLCTPTRSSSSNSKRKPSSSSTTHISARSFNVSETDSPSVMRKKKKKKRPMTASATAASKAYNSNTRPPALITERWASTPSLNRPPPAMRRQATPTSSMVSRSSLNPRTRGGQRSVTATPPPPSVNIDHVQSSLKSNRNYQPPRRRRLVKKKSKVRQKEADDDDYEDDFEKEVDDGGNCENGGDEADDDDDEEEEEDDAAGMMLFTKQWIDDQAVRGMVRQKALNEGGGSTNRGDKESSKDSAYGYSGGENSRLATREPTPDTQQQYNMYGSLRRRRQQHQQQPPPSSSNRRLSGRGDSLRTTGTSFNGTSRELDSEDEKSSAYVNFVTR